MTDKEKINAKEFALSAGRIAAELRCTNVTVLDLKGKSPATDYFVIATGTSNRQIRTVSDDISQLGREHGLERFGRAGYEQGKWVLLDFVDVVIHVFDAKYREYYDLEMLWGDAEKLSCK